MVILVQTTAQLLAERAKNSKIGFVPTMGNLHQGHISLLERALTEYKTVYFSIFVNPKQFGPNEDFARYPRTLENDISLIDKLTQRFPNSKVVVYSPKDPQEVFPENADQLISVWGLSTELEGKIRPGHFDGVATVVHRLFKLIKPETAYFGLKDYQQYMVIRQMVKDLNMAIKITGMPIIREESGLALSSRNQYLDPEQKNTSIIVSQTLKQIIKKLDGKRDNISKAREIIQEILNDSHWNYLEIRDSETFSLNTTSSNNITILAVYQLGTTRLLDNMQVEIQ
jgi:pantoate--beta-alanine ligase